jgi:hypothetical protein
MNNKTRLLPEFNLLKDLLLVDDQSPSGLKWKQYSKGRRKDLTAGSKTHNKRTGKTYWTVCIQQNSYMVHRIVYLMCTEKDPVGKVIDHINGDGTFNSFKNLRLVTQQENCFNHKLYKNNNCKFAGVSFNKLSKKYTAYIYLNFKRIHLGYFVSMEDAVIARQQAVDKYHMTQEDTQFLLPDDLK